MGLVEQVVGPLGQQPQVGVGIEMRARVAQQRSGLLHRQRQIPDRVPSTAVEMPDTAPPLVEPATAGA